MRLFTCLAALFASTALPAIAQNVIPTDAVQDCAIDPKTFAGWMAEGSTNDDPVFMPPDGFSAPFTSDCAFYQWGAQMFLWLTSTNNDALVFDSNGFFDVVHQSAGTEKVAVVKVLPNGGDTPNVFAIRDIKPVSRGGAEQAGGGAVLLSQSKSLTFYGMHVNDAYVAFRNGYTQHRDDFNFTQGDSAPERQFPSTKDQILQILEYGVGTGVITENPDAAMRAGPLEMKTSWVDASTVQSKDFVTITAQVPKFTPNADNTIWTADGVQTLELAMVGMHIAAPVLNHPELVWISYEHLSNSPMGTYLYNGKQVDGQPSVVMGRKFDPKGNWTFAAPGTIWPEEIDPNASVTSDGNIHAAKGERILPQDVVLFNPWGLAEGSESNLTSNTDLVALNASLIALLDGDQNARENYFQIGGIWTDGTLPGYQDYLIERGGLNLANSTMETFHQFGAQKTEAGGFIPRNCFDCHSVSGFDRYAPNNAGVSISHIFQGMQTYQP